ncbi:MAG: response regulator transcription factor [Bacteroidales bacterium]|nr:response regulator transcription factor [Bacteroidales bacterium]MCF8389488.1 response regulator transcription factor [Bacteroidales bacterium]
MIRVITIDDERRSREVLSELLSLISGVKIISEAGNVEEAVKEIREKKPDLIFLDIEMPKKSGFDLLRDIKNDNHIPAIIFVTAYDSYAIEAFKYSAFDYLLKPINREDLQNSLNRFREFRNKKNISDKLGELFRFMEEPKKLVFDLRTGLLIIEPEELVYCEADGNYTHLHLKTGRVEMVSFNIGYVEKLLQAYDFFRLNRSVLINKEHILKLDLRSKACEVSYNGKYLKFKISPAKLTELKALFI